MHVHRRPLQTSGNSRIGGDAAAGFCPTLAAPALEPLGVDLGREAVLAVVGLVASIGPLIAAGDHRDDRPKISPRAIRILGRTSTRSVAG